MSKAKKSYGQHFLHDEVVCTKIAKEIASIKDVQLIIEVGPGLGALTRHLYTSDKDFLAIEADKDMVTALYKNLPDLSKDAVLTADFLKVDLEKIIKGRCTALVGNFPYNISSQIVFKMLEHTGYIQHLVGMFQKEVSERIISPPGSKAYGILSVFSSVFYQGQSIIDVPPTAFRPPPKVNSSVIHLVKKEHPVRIDHPSLFRQVVKTAFGMRRKMLRNSLRGLGTKEMDTSDPIFSKRPEQMSVQDFIIVVEMIQSHGIQ